MSKSATHCMSSMFTKTSCILIPLVRQLTQITAKQMFGGVFFSAKFLNMLCFVKFSCDNPDFSTQLCFYKQHVYCYYRQMPRVTLNIPLCFNILLGEHSSIHPPSTPVSAWMQRWVKILFSCWPLKQEKWQMWERDWVWHKPSCVDTIYGPEHLGERTLMWQVLSLKWSTFTKNSPIKGKGLNQWQSNGNPRFIAAYGEWT